MRRFAHLGAVVATTAILVPALAAFYPAQDPAAVPSEQDGDVAPLTIDAITPKAVESDSTITITGEVTNTADTVLDGASIRFHYSDYPFYDRSQLAEYGSGEGLGRTSAEGPSVELDEPVEPGESAPFTLSVEAEDLDLKGFGVYPMAVEALNAGGQGIASVRSFLPYAQDDAPSAVDIAWVWPLRDYPRRTDDDTFLGTDLAASVSAEGRLGRLLTSGAQDESVDLEPDTPPTDPSPSASPSASSEDADDAEAARDTTEAARSDSDAVPLTWAVDPGVVSDIERLSAGTHDVLDDTAAEGGGEPTTTSREAVPAAAVWLEQAQAAMASGHVIATPYADPDVSALLAADLGEDLEAAERLGGATLARALGVTADADYALPPGGLLDAATASYYAEQGANRFLLNEDEMPAQPWVEHTPTAEAPMAVEGGEGSALVADPGLTDALGTESREPGSAALAQQLFIAETAMISGEQTDDDRTVIAMPPNDWNPDASFAQSVLKASDDLPWLSPVALDDIEDPSSDSERRPASGATVSDARLDSGHLDRVKDVRGDVRLFNSILMEDNDPFRAAILRAESAAWREEESQGALSTTFIGDAVHSDLGKVRIVPTDPVALASKSGTIGVIIANDLQDTDLTVRVKLSLNSGNPERMNIGTYTDELEIGPGAKTTVYVPLTARINGRTMIYQSLQNSMGEPLSSEETVTQVNATGLGYQALIIGGIGALVLVVALTPRALRKWVRKRNEADGEASQLPEDDAEATAGATAASPGTEQSADTLSEEPAADRAPDDGTAAQPPAADDETPGDATPHGGAPEDDDAPGADDASEGGSAPRGDVPDADPSTGDAMPGDGSSDDPRDR